MVVCVCVCMQMFFHMLWTCKCPSDNRQMGKYTDEWFLKPIPYCSLQPPSTTEDKGAVTCSQNQQSIECILVATVTVNSKDKCVVDPSHGLQSKLSSLCQVMECSHRTNTLLLYLGRSFRYLYLLLYLLFYSLWAQKSVLSTSYFF